jgi:hypothetical protein
MKLKHVGAFRAAWHVCLLMALAAGAWVTFWWWVA